VREVILYSRQGCHLCEVMLERAGPLCRDRASIVVRDIDTNPDWYDAYALEIPVLEIDGTEICRYELDEAALLAALNA